MRPFARCAGKDSPSLLTAHLSSTVTNDCSNNDIPRRFRFALIDSRLRERETKFRPVFDERVAGGPSLEEEEGNSLSLPLSLSPSFSFFLKVAKMPPAAAFMDNQPTGEEEQEVVQASAMSCQV